MQFRDQVDKSLLKSVEYYSNNNKLNSNVIGKCGHRRAKNISGEVCVSEKKQKVKNKNQKKRPLTKFRTIYNLSTKFQYTPSSTLFLPTIFQGWNITSPYHQFFCGLFDNFPHHLLTQTFYEKKIVLKKQPNISYRVTVINASKIIPK